MKKYHVTKGNVFDDLGFSSTEASNLKIRAVLIRPIVQEIVKRALTREKAAKVLGVTQPRVSELKCGKIQLFTIDALIDMLDKLNKPVAIIIDDRLVA